MTLAFFQNLFRGPDLLILLILIFVVFILMRPKKDSSDD